MKPLIIIPARMASSRFPNKPLAKINGVPLIDMVYRQASNGFLNVVVAACASDRVLIEHLQESKIRYVVTSDNAPTGTHRCAEAHFMVRGDYDSVVNWQCDEPFASASWVCLAVDRAVVGRSIATLVADMPSDIDVRYYDHSVVKVAVSKGACRWFSRASMRGAKLHCGIYAFHPSILYQLAQLPPTDLSRIESLEQLAWLESGYPIIAQQIPYLPQSINTPEDIEEACRCAALK